MYLFIVDGKFCGGGCEPYHQFLLNYICCLPCVLNF